MVFLKRQTTEKGINAFNPFILNVLGANMDFQFLIEEYSCAAYVVEYVNKTNRGISNLQRKIIEIMDEHPEFDIVEITRKLSIDLLNAVRKKTSRTLEDLTLAQATAYYTVTNNERKKWQVGPRIIRYHNYDTATELEVYKSEMVTLYLPFRNEEAEILAERKYIQIYNDNEITIMLARKEFESNLDIAKTMEICRQMFIANEETDQNDVENLAARVPAVDPFPDFNAVVNTETNAEMQMALLSRLGPVVRKRENLMLREDFNNLMRMATSLLMRVIKTLLDSESQPIQIFFTGPAGCGKTFVIKLLMEIYNRFTQTDGYCNAYITCASTGKAAVAINGLTIHTALKISFGKNLPLSNEAVQQFRTLFKQVLCIIIEEISMMSAEILLQVDARLKQITGNYGPVFGGKDIFLIGDLRHSQPVHATLIFNQIKMSLASPMLWRGLQFYQLTQIMRQSNASFSRILTKIGDGEKLEADEQRLIESRFVTKEHADNLCPHGVRLFLRNHDVNEYNLSILNRAEDRIVSIANYTFTGFHNAGQLAFVWQKLHKMLILSTGGLLYELTLVIDICHTSLQRT
ncbi:ATP-dependent DNA helicase [Trichonephila clavipes]|nr:ATP-dependent DNA helicase [Trichonephila clavipes]